MLKIEYWASEIEDIDDVKEIEEYLEREKQTLCHKIHKFRLKINKTDFLREYGKFVKENLSIYGNDMSKFDYKKVLKQKLSNEEWCAQNKSLSKVCTGILTEAPSNSMSEGLGRKGK